ncbi:uncharacterized protein KZ484_011473 [Pholidichthys leucotaenia]
MAILKRSPVLRYLLLSAMLALLLFFSSFWLPNSGIRDCDSAWQPCLSFYQPKNFDLVTMEHAFGSADEGILLHTQSDGKLFNPAHLRAKTKVRKVMLRDFLFADDAALVAHSEEHLQNLLNRFSNACKAFRLSISLKKMKVMCQGSKATPALTIKDYTLDVVLQFTYLGSTTSDNASLDVKLGKRIRKAATNMAKLSARVWENKKLTNQTKIAVYHPCVMSTLLYGSDSWATYAGQKKRLHTFHMRCLHCILSILWTDKPEFNSDGWAESDGAPPLIKECPGQSFQVLHLLQHLKSSLAQENDILLEPYLQSWDQLLNFMDALGPMVSFFSQKVREKVLLIRKLSLKHHTKAHGKPGDPSGLQTPAAFGLKTGVYRSVRSMVEAELKAGMVNFSRQTNSGCRTLLRLHRSQLWLKLMLQGLADGPDTDGQYKTPGELSRDAYKVALAPHHPWVLRQAAEFVFLALPDRKFFLQLVCVQSQEEAVPVLKVVISALTAVHQRNQQILDQHSMLDLP